MRRETEGQDGGRRSAELAELVDKINARFFASHPRTVADADERPARSHVCARCGHEWRTTADAPEPRACPSCRARKWQTPKPPRVSDTVRTCQICGYSWRARKQTRPCSCPRCDSPYWDAPESAKRRPRTAKAKRG